eukprot:TRINITY_DN1027_c0_g1_i3.p2 TRINITY_DN1027_c0_g1~~TRINITY_DN1027_c0_g1_i3.p2  ORF type:complete len:154 (-),score=21.99 TRINITY_DN1027_c0_g1_i3:888-1286(-)
MDDLKSLQSGDNQTPTGEKRKTDPNDSRDPKKLKIDGETDISNDQSNIELPELPIDIWKIITSLVTFDDFLKLLRLNSRFSKMFQRIFDEKISRTTQREYIWQPAKIDVGTSTIIPIMLSFGLEDYHSSSLG